MRIKLKVCGVLVLIATALSIASGQPSQFEVFPLSKNLAFKYSYLWEFESYFVSILEVSVTDSGSVEYVVRDSSSADDSTNAWTVEQRESLRHHEYEFGKDTTYWIVDTLLFTLTEGRQGNHEIQCSARVWAFPLSPSNQRIYRYAETSPYVLTLATGYPPFYDTLAFAADSGFTWRCRSRVIVGTGYSSDHLSVREIGHSYLSVASQSTSMSRYRLAQNYPNPFNPTTTIEYELPRSSHVTLKVHDLVGREVSVLVNERQDAGIHYAKFGAEGLSSGVYFYRLQAGGFVSVKRFLLLR